MEGSEFCAQQVVHAVSGERLKSQSAKAEGPLGPSVPVAGALQGKGRWGERGACSQEAQGQCGVGEPAWGG